MCSQCNNLQVDNIVWIEASWNMLILLFIINNKEEILSQGLSLQEGLLIAADAP